MDKYRIDGHKLMFHPMRVAQWLTADTWNEAKKLYPLYWEITTSAACNHRCTFCSTDAIGYPPILMDADILISRIKEASGLGLQSVMFAGTGEPLVHKRISEIVEKTAPYVDLAFTTNGVLLNKLHNLHMCKWVKISLNAGTRESYAAIHRTDAKDWDAVWKNIREAAKLKMDCALGVQAVVLPENCFEMGQLAELCIDAGVDYLVLKPYTQATFMLSHRYENIDYTSMRAYLKEVSQIRRGNFHVVYRGQAIEEEISKKHDYDKCRATPNFWVYSMADGRVFTCSAHLLDERFCIGNLNEQTFREIWEGEKRRECWEMMKTFDIKQCRLNCRMNGPNKYLHDLKHVPHVNFI